jgi:hypothetical protein
VKRNIYTPAGGHCCFRKQKGQVEGRAGDKLMPIIETNRVQTFVRQ